jgi:uncharacterized protein YpmS
MYIVQYRRKTIVMPAKTTTKRQELNTLVNSLILDMSHKKMRKIEKIDDLISL